MVLRHVQVNHINYEKLAIHPVLLAQVLPQLARHAQLLMRSAN
jgi:hypothetical protein